VPDSCIFCAVAAGDAPATVIYADDDAVAFLDINPATTGHTLVIPRRHVDGLLDADGAYAQIAPAIEATGALLVERLDADGINVFQSTGQAAGQVVFHLHVHLLPRWAGDGLLSLHTLRVPLREDREATRARLVD
jgi:histidine triad (HIT) family protein